MQAISKFVFRRGLFVLFVAAVCALLVAKLPIALAVKLAFVYSVGIIFFSARDNELISGPTIFLILLGIFHLGMVLPIYGFNAPFPYVPHVAFYRWLDWNILPYALSLYVLSAGSLLSGTYFIRSQKDFLPLNEKANFSTIRYGLRLWIVLYVVSILGYVSYGVFSGILNAPNRDLMLELQGAGQAVWFGFFKEWLIISTFGVIAFGKKKLGVVAAGITVLIFFRMFLVQLLNQH